MRCKCPQAVAVAVTACVLALGIAACSRTPPPPIQLGFVGGLTGRTADLGTSGRNGVQLAIEQANAAGGIGQREIRLTIRDDTSNPDTAKAVVGELIASKVDAIIGPMTSSVAVAVAPLATEAGILMMAGTVTTKELAGKDDQFFRAIATTEQHAATMADFLWHKRAIRKVNLLVNLANRAYTESWANDFVVPFEKLGGKIHRIEYTSSDDTKFDVLAKQLAAEKPDAIIMVTNALDASNLGNQLKRIDSRALRVVSEWAGTGRLIELGGQHVEDFIVPQYLDPTSQSQAYLDFRAAFVKRFQHEPGYPAMAGYNATNIVLQGLRQQKSGESLKQTLLRLKTFDGVQERVTFDAYGDVQSSTHLMQVKGGHYVVAQ